MRGIAIRLPCHYAWVIVAGGVVTTFACLGLGRFALGMLLPSMGHALSLTRAEMGWISTANFVGYLAAVSLAGRMVARLGARRTIVVGLLLVGVSMALIARAEGFVSVAALYVLTGYGSGAANVPVIVLLTYWFDRSARGRAAGVVLMGAGAAIIASGWLVPAMNRQYGVAGWRGSWLVMAACALLAALVGGLVLRNHPAEVGLAALGATAPSRAPVSRATTPVSRARILAHLGALYAAFGFTYVIYATFIVTALVQERGFPESTAGWFWSLIGLLSLASGPVFGGLSDRLGRSHGMMLVFGFQASAYALVALPLPPIFLWLSIVLFGLAMWSIPSIMAAAVGDYLGPEQTATAFGKITVAFALGQILGPTLAGRLAEGGSGFAGSFAMASAIAALGVVGAACLPQPPRSPSSH